MSIGLILLIVIIVLLFGGGFGYYRGGWQGSGPGIGIFGVIVILLIIWLLLGHRF